MVQKSDLGFFLALKALGMIGVLIFCLDAGSVQSGTWKYQGGAPFMYPLVAIAFVMGGTHLLVIERQRRVAAARKLDELKELRNLAP